MPMNKDNTQSVSAHKKSQNATKSAQRPQVSEKTLTFLRAFARNCYFEKELPNDLQGIILG